MKTLDVLLCGLVSGSLLCWVHGYFPYFGLVALVPLLLGLKEATPRQAFYAGLLCGGLESFILMGTLHYNWTIFTGLFLSYGLERSLFCLAVVALGRKKSPMLHSLLVPALWVALELIHSDLPATLPNILGDTQHVGVFLPLAYVGGSFLISFVLVWGNAALAELTYGKLKSLSNSGAVFPTLVWLAVAPTLSAGSAVLMDEVASPTKSVTIIQGGYPRWVNEAAESDSEWKLFPLRIYEELSLKAPPSDLTLWPEGPLWLNWGESPELEKALGRIGRLRPPLIAGVLRRDDGGTYFNSAFMFDDDTVEFRDKQRLVLQEERGFGQGTQPAVFDTKLGRMGAVFCLESVVPAYTRRLVQEGAQAIVVLANGADLGRTPVARLHAQRSIVRAVETGRWLLHAGHQGFSMVISPRGQTTAPARRFESAVVVGDFNLRTSVSPYTNWGDRPLGFGVFLLLGWCGFLGIKSRLKED